MSRFQYAIFTAVVLAALLPAGDAKKIMIATMPGGISHLLEILQVAEQLVQKGHSAISVLEDWDLEGASSKLPAKQNISFIEISLFPTVAEGRAFFQEQVEMEKQNEGLQSLSLFIRMQATKCKLFLSNPEALDKLRSAKADLMIVDSTYPCAGILADLLDLPYVLFSPTSALEPIQSSMLGYKSCTATVPAFSSGRGPPRNLMERLFNWVQFRASETLVEPLFTKLVKDLRKEFKVAPRPENARLFMANADFAIEFPRPLPPGVKFVGPLLASPSKPLTGELARLTDAVENGFVYVAFGSVFQLTDPAELKTMAAALSSLNRTVLWRITQSELPKELTMKDLLLGPNVHTIAWAPQNDILGSSKLAVFVSHGGTNSVYESAYHGVPMVNIPFMGDHRDHAKRAELRGFGLTVPRGTLSRGNPSPLAAAIERVSSRPEFKAAAEYVGEQLRAHPTPAPVRAAEWVETALALPPGSNIAMGDPAAKLSWHIRFAHDVHAILIGLGYVLLAALYTFVVIAVKLVFRVKRTLGNGRGGSGGGGPKKEL